MVKLTKRVALNIPSSSSRLDLSYFFYLQTFSLKQRVNWANKRNMSRFIDVSVKLQTFNDIRYAINTFNFSISQLFCHSSPPCWYVQHSRFSIKPEMFNKITWIFNRQTRAVVSTTETATVILVAYLKKLSLQ